MLLPVLARVSWSEPQLACFATTSGAFESFHVALLGMLVAFVLARYGFCKWINKRCSANMCCGTLLLLMLHQSHFAFRIADASFDAYPGRARFYPLAVTFTTRLHSPSCLPDHYQPCSPAVIFPIHIPILLSHADTWYNWQLVYDAAAPLFGFYIGALARGWRMDPGATALTRVGLVGGRETTFGCDTAFGRGTVSTGTLLSIEKLCVSHWKTFRKPTLQPHTDHNDPHLSRTDPRFCPHAWTHAYTGADARFLLDQREVGRGPQGAARSGGGGNAGGEARGFKEGARRGRGCQ